MMAPEVKMFTVNHRFSDMSIPMTEQGVSNPKPIIIGNDVWIGSNVIIQPGVTIGTGSIIGAGGVLRESVPPYSIAAGNPAAVVGKRENRGIKNEHKKEQDKS